MKIKTGLFRHCLVRLVLNNLDRLQIEEIRQKYTDEDFVQTQPTSLDKEHKLKNLCQLIGIKVAELVDRFPHRQEWASSALKVVPYLEQFTANGEGLLRIYQAILELFAEAGLEIARATESNCFIVTAKDGYIFIHPISERLSLKDGSKPEEFIPSVMRLREILRQENRLPTPDESIAIQVGCQLIESGDKIDYPYQHWGTSGFRTIPTWMSITDPGEGHIEGTARRLDYLSGVIVHIEHLERGHQDRHQVESYRIPNNKNAALVRLAIGSDAPISSYVGRPVFENGCEAGFRKTCHTVAAAISELFGLGLAECKIAIEGMTATQAIEYMQAIAAAVRRDRHSQILSAAFNINTPIVDDRSPAPHCVFEPLAIGLLGIELATAGGCQKVTWDGSANTYPSNCILEQLSHEQALLLVHQAHERGLLTYFSAGFRYHHLPLAVDLGVDGVGVGGAQILRYMDKNTGYHGPFKPENIAEILKIRDLAAAGWLGQAAALLSRLDRMFYEGSLLADDDPYRLELFAAVRQKDRSTCERLLERFAAIRRMPPDAEHPLIAWGQRLIAAGDSCLLGQSHHSWATLVRTLQKAIETEDLDLLADELEAARQSSSRLYPLESLSPPTVWQAA